MAENILRLKVDSQEYDNKLKRAAEGLNRYVEGCRKVGGTLEYVEKETLDFVKAMGQMETTSKTATGKLAEMKKTFTEWGMVYKQMTDAEKASPMGKALSQSLDQLRTRIKETQRDLQSINQELSSGKFGQFGSIIDGIGQKMGIGGNLTELLTSKTALMTAGIGAATAAIGKSTEAWIKYNSELAKQDQITTVTTGLKDDNAERMTDNMRALSDTYNVDFREAINAANTLMSQFGESGDSAIALIRDGMQGMIHGDGGKMLSMIQQYAPAFRDAGVSASQLVAVIQNSEGGIFTDQNMQAIVMGIKNIRLMTKATSDALAQLGIDGQKMSEQLSNGTLTIFDALKQVAGELKNVDSNSKTAGEVMQTVFGRQGAMAGTNLAKAIEGLNTNLEETKRQTGEVGDAFDDLYKANLKLNTAIREAFEYDGWEQMATGIKSKLVTALAEVVGWLGEIRKMLSGDNTVGWNITPKPGVTNVADDPNVDDNGNYIRKNWNSGSMKVVTPTVTPTPLPTTKTTPKGTTKTPKTEEQLNNENIQKLTQEYIKASDDRRKAIEIEIKTLQDRNKEIKRLTDIAQGNAAPEGSLNALNEQLKQLQTERGKLSDPIEIEIQDQQIKEVQDEIDRLNGKKVDVELEVNDKTPFEQFEQSLRIQMSEKNIEVDTNTLKTLMQTAIQNNIDGMDIKFASIFENLKNGIPDDTWKSLQDEINAKLKEMGIAPINIDFATGDNKRGREVKSSNELSKINQDVSKMTSGISGIFSGIQQMGIEIPKGISETLSVLQGMTTIMTAITTILSIIEATSTVTATTSAVKAIPVIGWALARGGIVHAEGGYKVPGNYMSNDQVPAMLNSGELVLNRAQQGNLASQLTASERSGGGYSPSHISGEQIWIALNRYTKRTGQGEIVTWK